MTDYLIGVVHATVRTRFGTMKTCALHDLASMEDYEFDARNALVGWCVQHRHEFTQTGIAHPKLTPFWNMAIQAAKFTLDAGGFPFRLYPSVEHGIEVLGVQPLSWAT